MTLEKRTAISLSLFIICMMCLGVIVTILSSLSVCTWASEGPFARSNPAKAASCSPHMQMSEQLGQRTVDTRDFDRGNVLFIRRNEHTEDHWSLPEDLTEDYEEWLMTSKGRDSGFDLFVAGDTVVSPDRDAVSVHSRVSCMMLTDGEPSGFWLVPRSSLSKTPLMMANSIGVIDAGYRGELIGKVRNLSSSAFAIAGGARLFQVVAPNMRPIFPVLVDSLPESERGAGSFGSTGA